MLEWVVTSDRHWRWRNPTTLWVLILVGSIYSGFIVYQGTLTGANNVDGLIGVVFGLYICSHPAANLVDMLFFRRETRRDLWTKRSVLLWLAFNLLVLMVGWTVIFVGTTRLIGRGEGL